MLKSSKKVLSANLANQCYRDYFCDFWQHPLSDMGETKQPAASPDRSCRWPLQRRQSLKVFEAGKRWRNLGYLRFIDRRGGHPFTEPGAHIRGPAASHFDWLTVDASTETNYKYHRVLSSKFKERW